MRAWAQRGLVQARHRIYLLLLAGASHLPPGQAYAVARWLGRVRYRRLPRSLWLNDDVRGALGLSRADIVQLASNSFEASFLPRGEKDAWLRRVRELDAD